MLTKLGWKVAKWRKAQLRSKRKKQFCTERAFDTTPRADRNGAQIQTSIAQW